MKDFGTGILHKTNRLPNIFCIGFTNTLKVFQKNVHIGTEKELSETPGTLTDLITKLKKELQERIELLEKRLR